MKSGDDGRPSTPVQYLSRHVRINNCIFYGLLLPCLICCGMLMYVAIFGKVFLPFSWTVSETAQYLLMIDAGSHGTRVHIYSFPARIQDPNAVHVANRISIPRHIFQYSAKTGISSMMASPEKTGSHCVQPLIDVAVKELSRRGVRRSQLRETPVYLQATAGMRDMDPDDRGRIMESIRLFLANRKKSPFAFQSSFARVLSGEEEGMFGWLAVNNVMGTLLLPANGTIGALDMGGASAQITFSPFHTSVIEGFYEVFLGDKMIRLFSHSFLGYGWGDALKRLTTRASVEVVLEHLQAKGFYGKSLEAFAHAIVTSSDPSEFSDRPAAWLNQTAVLREEKEGDVRTVFVDAEHPCLPAGYNFEFDVPSLMYPSGRFFLDLDRRVIFQYMSSLGLDTAAMIHRLSDIADLPEGPMVVARDDSLFDDDDDDLETPLGSKPRKLQTAPSPAPVTPAVRPLFPIPGKQSQLLPHHLLPDVYDTRVDGHEESFHPFDRPHGKKRVRFKISYSGKWDIKRCQSRARSLFYDQPCFTHSCNFNGVYQPRLVESKFVAFGQFAKVQQALGIPENPSMNTMERYVDKVCVRPFSEIKKMAEEGKLKPFGPKNVHKLCWKALWCHTALTWGYGFPEDSTAVRYAPTKGEAATAKSTGWTEGSAILTANQMPMITAMGRFKVPFYVSFVTALLLALLSSMLLLQINNLVKMVHFHDPGLYQPLTAV